jgi:hypothetical protein
MTVFCALLGCHNYDLDFAIADAFCAPTNTFCCKALLFTLGGKRIEEDSHIGDKNHCNIYDGASTGNSNTNLLGFFRILILFLFSIAFRFFIPPSA